MSKPKKLTKRELNELSKLSSRELLLLRYQIENRIREQRVRAVLQALAKGDHGSTRLGFLEQSLERELKFAQPRAIFLDDILEQMEILLNID